jgi:putative transcriptional regulator
MTSLQNQFLIAMPSLDDGYFNKTVTYICEHDEKGAMGLIINLPINITLQELLEQIDEEDESTDEKTIDASSQNLIEFSDENEQQDERNSLEQLVLSGGPVGQQRGFVLHSTQQGWGSSLALNKELMITTSKDILLALGTTDEPEKFMVTLGYASWGPGQLEEELQSNSWLTAPADNDIIFNTPIEQRWKKATNNLGIDLAHLSNEIGHA